MTTGRPEPPHSQDAEESVIGGILLHPRVFSEVVVSLEPGDFYHPALRAIFEAMFELDQSSKPIDALTVAEEMRKAQTLDKLRAFNGAEYLTELMGKVVTVSNIGFHAKLVREKAAARRMVQVGTEITAKGLGDLGDVGEYLEDAERLVFEAARLNSGDVYKPVKEVLRAVIEQVGERSQRPRGVTGVPTGLGKLDDLTSGLQPGDLVIVGGRPSMGKTSALMAFMTQACVEKKLPGLVFSAEMSKESLVERLLSSEGRIASQKLRSGLLATPDWVRMTSAASRISEAPLMIDDSGAPSLVQIRSKARRWRNDRKLWAPVDAEAPELGIIGVDYLQLLNAGGARRPENRQQEVSEISRGLKALAKELHVPVVALSQLSRELEKRSDKRPMPADLRESGAVEQDADVIIFIYRDEVYTREECKEPGIAEFILGKQRNGPTGVCKVKWQDEYTRFDPLHEEPQPF